MKRVPPHMTAFARALRRDMTQAERKLWRILSPYRPRFTRQLVVGRCMIDIANRQAKLAIELDGGQHAEQAALDAQRTAALEHLGWIVLRFWNHDVLANPEGVAQTVLTAVVQRLGHVTHPQPLPCREGRSRKDRRLLDGE